MSTHKKCWEKKIHLLALYVYVCVCVTSFSRLCIPMKMTCSTLMKIEIERTHNGSGNHNGKQKTDKKKFVDKIKEITLKKNQSLVIDHLYLSTQNMASNGFPFNLKTFPHFLHKTLNSIHSRSAQHQFFTVDSFRIFLSFKFVCVPFIYFICLQWFPLKESISERKKKSALWCNDVLFYNHFGA